VGPSPDRPEGLALELRADCSRCVGLCCVALAWFSFLRDDGFARRPPEAVSAAGAQAPAEPRPAEPLTVSGLGSGDGLDQHGPVAGGLDASLFAPRDGSLVGRRVAEPSSGNRSGAAAHPREGSAGRAALLWAAVELGAASACLYAWAGLGSSFYR